MKNNPITIGFDDAKFFLHSEEKTTQLIGVVCQGTRMINVIRRDIEVDGEDSTEKLIEIIKSIEKHVQYVLTDSITFGGFNIYDMKEVYKQTNKPIIAINEQEVDLDAVKKALTKKYNDDTYKRKINCILNAGNLYETKIRTAGGLSKVQYHCIGITSNIVEELLDKVCIDSKLPEPVRMAHIIGTTF